MREPGKYDEEVRFMQNKEEGERESDTIPLWHG
jgi:hypothetical protein